MSEINPITGLPLEESNGQTTEQQKVLQQEADQHREATAQAVKEAAEKFERERKGKSFSGRHPELGPMIKCYVCNRRHRDNEQCLIRYATTVNKDQPCEPRIAETKKLRIPANPFGWRPKIGRFVWFNTLKKFIKLA